MKKSFLAIVLSMAIVASSFALDMAGKINQFGSYDNVESLTITVYPSGNAFPMVKSFKWDKKAEQSQIKSVSQEGDLLKIVADTGKYQYDMVVSTKSILDIKMVNNYNKKLNKKTAKIFVIITTNDNSDSIGDFIVNNFKTVNNVLMVPGAVPGMGFIPLGCKSENVKSVEKVNGDIINVKFNNDWEWFMPQGAYCMAFTCKNVAKDTVSLQMYGAGNCDNNGYATLFADKLNSGKINKVIFYGQLIAPISFDSNVKAKAEDGNYLSVVYSCKTDKPEKMQAVGDEWYWDTFKLSGARFGLYKGTDFLMFY